MRLTELVHHDLAQYLQAGDVVIDATAGNGHDTLFLAQCVAPHGQVFAFDIQQQALNNTRLRLQQHTQLAPVQLILSSHAQMSEHIPLHHHGHIAAITFNLGYLPGTDHTQTTDLNDTVQALKQAASLLKTGGLLSILAYTAHPGGRQEADAVNIWVQGQQQHFHIYQNIPQNTRQSPPEYTLMRKLT